MYVNTVVRGQTHVTVQTQIPLHRLIKHQQWIQMKEKNTNQSVLTFETS